MRSLPLAAVAFAIGVYLLAVAPDAARVAAQGKKKQSGPEEALAQVKLADANLKVAVWAAEPLMANPVSFCFDEKGRAYVAETTRFENGVPDTRSHMKWLDEDLANRTIDDLVAMYKKHNYLGFEKYDDQVRVVWDSKGEGKADRSEVFAKGFNRSQDGLMAGVLARKSDVYVTNIPDLYLLKDTNGDNKADVKKSLFTGFGMTAQFLGHDLHGLRIGPDGRLYFSIGDRGFNVKTREGKQLLYPNQGAVLRCDLDGKNLEVVHAGLRNPQEIAFDDYGNLFTYDNNSDSGDRARWVHIVEGGDSGWRGGFQYGTQYHTPGVPQGNRGPWNTEKLWLPQHEGQPAYIVPPLLNFGNGPAGITHYPGVGLSDKYKDHFFCCDFTSNAGSSVIWTLSVKPKGAGFEVAKQPEAFVRGMVPTDCDFGPDGAFYWSDWVGGWSPPGKGRIFRVTDPEAMKNPAVEEAKTLLAEGVGRKTLVQLVNLLEHPHQQVRQEAQFELARRAGGKKGDVQVVIRLSDIIKSSQANMLARVHAVWAQAMVVRDDPRKRNSLIHEFHGLPPDADPEVRCQLLKAMREFGIDDDAAMGLVPYLKDKSPRVRYFTAQLLGGKLEPGTSFERREYPPKIVAAVLEMLDANADRDPYLRHAGVMALASLARDLKVDITPATGASPAVRLAVALAYRKNKSDRVAEFLKDDDSRIVAEAARAIYDARIEGAQEALAKLAEKTGQPDAVAYRALAANYTLGTPEAAARVAKFAGRASEPDHTRAFALKLLGDWTKPPRRDPITGLTLDLPARDAAVAATAIQGVGGAIFAGTDVVRREASQVVAKLGLKEFGPQMAAIVKDATQPVNLRVDALYAVDALKDAATKDLVAFTLAAKEPKLRAAGLTVKAKLEPAAVLKELPALLKDDKASLAEKQAAFAVLAAARSSPDADKLLDEWLDATIAKKVPQELILDVLDAAETRANTPKLKLSAPLKAKVEQYRGEQAKQADKLASFLESLAGGDAEKGRDIFLNNSAVYCQRCHKLDGQGGDVGPLMNGIAADKEKDRRYLLESIALPSAKIAKGFETVILVLEDERTISGIIKSEDKTNIKLVTAENKEVVVPVKDVAARRTGPSAMPDDLHKKMTRRELRDVVEFLASLKEPPKK